MNYDSTWVASWTWLTLNKLAAARTYLSKNLPHALRYFRLTYFEKQWKTQNTEVAFCNKFTFRKYTKFVRVYHSTRRVISKENISGDWPLNIYSHVSAVFTACILVTYHNQFAFSHEYLPQHLFIWLEMLQFGPGLGHFQRNYSGFLVLHNHMQGALMTIKLVCFSYCVVGSAQAKRQKILFSPRVPHSACFPGCFLSSHWAFTSLPSPLVIPHNNAINLK